MTIYWIVILFFAALSLGLVAIYLAYAAVQARPHHEVKKRLRELATNMDDRRFPADLRVEILGEMGLVDKFFYRFGFGKRIHRLIDSAGFKVDMKIYAAVTIFLAVVGFTAGILLGRGALGPLLLTPVGALIPLYFLLRKKRARIAKFTEFFPDTLDMISRSLKAGHSLSAAIQLVGTEMPEPTGGLFRTAYEEQTLGLSARESLQHLSLRMDSTDMRFFIMATNIHREVGGNLGEILERLARTIRERIVVRRQVKVYSAQARLSGYILAAAPVAMGLFFYFFVPGYVEELLTVEWGRLAIIFAVIAQVAGFVVIKKITNIRI
ncbi:MAG: type II secretion system F family protein [Deltaproteobacteria bacterium]